MRWALQDYLKGPFGIHDVARGVSSVRLNDLPPGLIANHDYDLSAFLQGADHVDIKTIESGVDLRSFISGMLSYFPKWLGVLFNIRQVLARLLGLTTVVKDGAHFSVTPEKVTFTPGRAVGVFTVRQAQYPLYWFAETPDDKHLRAYFGVIAEPESDRLQRYYVFTSVFFKHWTGPLYFNLIRPFHHLVVASMMRAGACHNA